MNIRLNNNFYYCRLKGDGNCMLNAVLESCEFLEESDRKNLEPINSVWLSSITLLINKNCCLMNLRKISNTVMVHSKTPSQEMEDIRSKRI